jgi:hypothetical protein
MSTLTKGCEVQWCSPPRYSPGVDEFADIRAQRTALGDDWWFLGEHQPPGHKRPHLQIRRPGDMRAVARLAPAEQVAAEFMTASLEMVDRLLRGVDTRDQEIEHFRRALQDAEEACARAEAEAAAARADADAARAEAAGGRSAA